MCMCVCDCIKYGTYTGRGLVKWVGLDLGVNNSHHVIKNSINTAEYMYIGRGCPFNQEIY